jgi:hypothetical protein
MKTALPLGVILTLAASNLAIPQFAAAQAYRDYGPYDPCRAEQRRAANNGTVAGGVLGAVLGSAIAGRGNRFGGAVVGGAVGAVAGHAVGKSTVKCLAYPTRYRPRLHCRWIQEYNGGVYHQFEVCRGADGVWRPSGRR